MLSTYAALIAHARLLVALPFFLGPAYPAAADGQAAALLMPEHGQPALSALVADSPFDWLAENPFPPLVRMLDQEIPPFRHAPAIGAGALGGIIGFGVPIVAVLSNPSAVTEDAFPYLLLAAGVTGSAGTPVGVWLAGGRRGRLGPAVLASLATGAAGLTLGFGADLWPFAVATPVAQVAAAVAIEKHTRREPGYDPLSGPRN